MLPQSNLNFLFSLSESLEERVLFDGVPDAAVILPANDVAEVPQAAEVQRLDAEVTVPQQLVFIDGRVADRDALLSEIIESNPDSQLEIRILDSNRDGVAQITEVLRGSNQTYDAVHILSHGSDGQVTLGNTTLNESNLAGYSDQIASWSDSLSSDADLLIYGCDLAGSESGQQFIEHIAALSGADVAASDDLTGNAALGGDWDLEVNVGTVETAAFSATSFNGILAAPVAVDDAYAIVPGEATNIDPRANDSDADSDPLSITQITDVLSNVTTTLTAAGDTATLVSGTTIELQADGSLNVLTAANSLDTETFLYTLSDSTSTAIGTVTIAVDTDGDGIANAIDLDDDNDGIVDVDENVATGTRIESGGNLFTPFNNGTFGFEDGSPDQSPTIDPYPGTVSGGDFETYQDIVFGDYGFAANILTGRHPSQHTPVIDPVYGVEGRFFVSDPDANTPTLTATVNNLVVGETYNYSFWAANSENGPSNSIDVVLGGSVDATTGEITGGSTIFNTGPLDPNGMNTIPWTKYEVTFVATATSQTIHQRSTETGPRGNDFLVDNIELRLTGIDSDGDGIANSLDIDSDNDGITDNVEAQTTAGYIAPSGLGNSPTFVDSNMDGLDDNFDAGVIAGGAPTGAGLTPVNTDSMDNPDYLDTDSDNTGGTDAMEAGHGITQAAIDASADTDNDGLKDVVEGASVTDGYDVNDENVTIIGSGAAAAIDTFLLTDSDSDTAADGTNAAPTAVDLDYRDSVQTLSFSIDDVAVDEAAGTATFTVNLSAASATATSVNYATADGSATAGADYTATSGTLNFVPGETSQTITVTITDDSIGEAAEAYTVVLAMPTGATISDGTGVGTINDETVGDAPTLALTGQPTVNEGAMANYVLMVSAAPTTDMEITISIVDVDTTTGEVTPATQTVTIAAGTMFANFTVNTQHDVYAEPDEDFQVAITGVSGGGFEAAPAAPANVTTTIIDEDTDGVPSNEPGEDVPVLLLNGDTNITEGGTATYTVSVSDAPLTDMDVTVEIGQITTDAGDITPVTRTVTIVAGTTSTDFTVTNIDNTTVESDEDYSVTVTGSTGGGYEATPVNPVAITTTIADDDVVLNLSINDVAIDEDAGTATFTVSLSDTPTSSVTVDYSTVDGTATAGIDYTAASGTLTFAPGTTTQTITVPISDDLLAEGSEDYNVVLAMPTGATILNGTGVGTINDEAVGDAPTLTLTGDTSVAEGSAASYTLSVNQAPTTDLDITVALVNVDTMTGEVGPATQTITIAAGTTSTDFTLNNLEDVYAEIDEDYQVSVTGATGGSYEVAPAAPAAVTTTIVDEDTDGAPSNETGEDAPTLTLTGDANVNEGGTATYTVAISDAPVSDIDVTVVVGHITTDAGDIAPVTQTVTIAAGTTSTDFTVTNIDNTTNEPAEDYSVTITGSSGGGFEATPVNPPAVTTTIADNDAVAPQLSIDDVAVDEDAGTATFTVSLSTASASPVTVDYSTADGTATAGIDYTAASGTLTFAPGATTQTIAVPISDDLLAEGAEDYNVVLAMPTGATILDGIGVGTINDEAFGDAPTLTLTGQPTVNEGVAANYVLMVSAAPTSDMEVTISIANVNTTTGEVTPATQMVTIAAGTMFANFTVDNQEDVYAEPDEDFQVTVTGVTNGGFEVAPAAPAAVTTTIVDEDTDGVPSNEAGEDAPILLLTGDANVNEGGTATYTVSVSDAPLTDMDVTVEIGQITTDTGDITPVTQTVTIAAGTTSTDFTVTNIDDTTNELAKDYSVTITGSSSGGFEATSVNPLAVTTTIADNDAVAPQLSIDDVAVDEDAGTATFTVSLSTASASPVTVDYSTADGTATAGIDYTAASGTLTFAPGATTQTIAVPISDDLLAEGAEDYNVVLAMPTGATILDGTGLGTINDEAVGDTPTLTLTGDASVAEGSAASYTLSVNQAPTTDLDITVALVNVDTMTGEVGPATQTVTIVAGTTSTDFTLNNLEDVYAEIDEDYQVSVTGATGGGYEGAPAAPAAVTTAIVDEDTDGAPSNETGEDAPTLTLTGDVNVNEGGTATYTVAISDAPVSDMDITVVVGHVTTDAGDIAPVTQTVTIAAGTTSTDFTVTNIDNTVGETAEDYSVFVTGSSGGGFEATSVNPPAVTTTIVDNDGAPQLLISDASVDEDAGTATFTVMLSNPAPTSVSVDYATADGSAAGGADFTPETGTLTFAPGTTAQTITVAITDDNIAEGAEGYTVMLSNPIGAGIADDTGAGTINDEASGDSPTLTLTGTPTVAEGTTANYTLTISAAPATDLEVTVVVGNIDTLAGEAGPVTQIVTIAAGTTSTDFTINNLEDVYAEIDEDYSVSVTGTNGGGFEVAPTAPPAYVTTIVDEDTDSTPGNETGEDAPVLTLTGDATVGEGALANYTLAISDAPASDLDVTVVVGNVTTDSGDVVPVTRIYTITAGTTSVNFTVGNNDDALAEADETFTVSVSDSSGGGFEALPANPAAVTTAIVDEDTDGVGGNEPGEDAVTVSIAGPASVAEGSTTTDYTISLSDTVPAGGSVTVNLSYVGVAVDGTDYNGTASVSVPAGSSEVTFTIPTVADNTAEGPESFTVSIESIVDNGGSFESTAVDALARAVTTTINDDNQPPVANDDFNNTLTDTPVSGNVLGNDTDPDTGDSLTVTLVNGAAFTVGIPITTGSGSIVFDTNGNYTYTPNPGATGTDTLTYTVSDSVGNTAQAPLTIEIRDTTTPGTTAPVANNDSATTFRDQPVTGSLTSNDGDPTNQPITITPTPVSGPTYGTVVINPDGTYTYTPNPGYVGPDTFEYQIQDPDGNTDTATVTITVAADPNGPANDPPVANADAALGTKGVPVSGNLLANDSDPNGDTLTASTTPVTGPANGTVVINTDGTFTYTPDAGFVGNDTFVYEISDPSGAVSTAAFQLTIFNQAPAAGNDSYESDPAGGPVTGSVFGNDFDPDGDPLTSGLLSSPSFGTVVLNPDGTFVYTPGPDFTGTDTFTYEVRDSSGATSVGTVNIIRPSSAATTSGNPARLPALSPPFVQRISNSLGFLGGPGTTYGGIPIRANANPLSLDNGLPVTGGYSMDIAAPLDATAPLEYCGCGDESLVQPGYDAGVPVYHGIDELQAYPDGPDQIIDGCTPAVETMNFIPALPGEVILESNGSFECGMIFDDGQLPSGEVISAEAVTPAEQGIAIGEATDTQDDKAVKRPSFLKKIQNWMAG